MNQYLILLENGRGHFIKSTNEGCVMNELKEGSYYLETHKSLKDALKQSNLKEIILVGEYKRYNDDFNTAYGNIMEKYSLYNRLIS
jgi:hypothetical protein